MSKIGHIGEFDHEKEDWESYTERLELYCSANNIEETRKVPTLLTVVGPKSYKTLKTLLAPEKPATKSYDELVKIMQKHVKPKPTVIAVRDQFYSRKRHDDETVLQFAAAIKEISEDCNFKPDFLLETLRDRFVTGLRIEHIQRELFIKDAETLTYEKAVETATAMEAAHKYATNMHTENVHYMQASKLSGDTAKEKKVTSMDQNAIDVIAEAMTQIAASIKSQPAMPVHVRGI